MEAALAADQKRSGQLQVRAKVLVRTKDSWPSACHTPLRHAHLCCHCLAVAGAPSSPGVCDLTGDADGKIDCALILDASTVALLGTGT